MTIPYNELMQKARISPGPAEQKLDYSNVGSRAGMTAAVRAIIAVQEIMERDMDFSSYEHKYMHKGLDGCGQVAFYFNAPVVKGGRICAEDAVFSNGIKPNPNQPFWCGSCREFFISQEPILEYVEDNK